MLESDLASWKCFLLSLPSLSTAFFSFWKACESEERGSRIQQKFAPERNKNNWRFDFWSDPISFGIL